MTAAVSRRTALAAIGGLGLATAGCDARDLDPRSDPPTPTVTLQAPAPADEQADLETLDQVVTETVATLALVEAVLERHPGLSDRLDPLVSLHRRHRDLLAEAAKDQEPPAAPSVQPPAKRPAALRLVVSTEEVTRGRYEGWALDARSGPFARLLAGMSAGVAQHAAWVEASR